MNDKERYIDSALRAFTHPRPHPHTPLLPIPTKAISIRQPWAALIACGVKTIEVRKWRGAPSYRGPLFIHASAGEEDVVNGYPNVPEIHEVSKLRGGFIAVAELADVIHYVNPKKFDGDWELHRNPERSWQPGLLGLVLRNIHPIPFIWYRGSLGLFNVDLSNRPGPGRKPTPYLARRKKR